MYIGVIYRIIGIMEKKMENAILYRVYRGYIGIYQKSETTQVASNWAKISCAHAPINSTLLGTL